MIDTFWSLLFTNDPEPQNLRPTQLGSDFEDLGHLRGQNDVIMSWLRLITTYYCFPHPY